MQTPGSVYTGRRVQTPGCVCTACFLSRFSLSESLHKDGRTEVPSGGQVQGVVGCTLSVSL